MNAPWAKNRRRIAKGGGDMPPQYEEEGVVWLSKKGRLESMERDIRREGKQPWDQNIPHH